MSSRKFSLADKPRAGVPQGFNSREGVFHFKDFPRSIFQYLQNLYPRALEIQRTNENHGREFTSGRVDTMNFQDKSHVHSLAAERMFLRYSTGRSCQRPRQRQALQTKLLVIDRRRRRADSTSPTSLLNSYALVNFATWAIAQLLCGARFLSTSYVAYSDGKSSTQWVGMSLHFWDRWKLIAWSLTVPVFPWSLHAQSWWLQKATLGPVF